MAAEPTGGKTALRAYEVMVILDPSLEERTVEPSLDKYLNVIRKDGGSVESVDVWGRRRRRRSRRPGRHRCGRSW